MAELDRDCGKDTQDAVAMTFQFRDNVDRVTTTTDGVANGFNKAFGVSPFFTPCGPLDALGPDSANLDFSLRAPTTSKNLFRVLRALQVRFVLFVCGCYFGKCTVDTSAQSWTCLVLQGGCTHLAQIYWSRSTYYPFINKKGMLRVPLFAIAFDRCAKLFCLRVALAWAKQALYQL